MGVLDGKVALVTGAGNGIGRAVALELAAEGAAVIVNDLGGDWHGEGRNSTAADRVAEEIRAAGGQALPDPGDVASSDDAARMVQTALDSFGSLEVVVNTAGILRDRTIASMRDEEWDAVIRIHLRGHFCVTRAAAAHWRARAKETGEAVYGRVVCFTSEAGIYGNPGQCNYAAAKGGVIGFASAIAHELGRYGVTCNTIAPRARTRMTVGTFGDALPKSEGYDVWDPVNVAPAVTFLASPQGGSYSGQLLVAGGGVVQVVEHFRSGEELRVADRKPSLEDVADVLARARGASASPPVFPLAQELLEAART